MQNSICFGVFDFNHKQIGFARITTDFVVFAWLMDVFIDESYRGKGVGKMLMYYILNYPELLGIKGIGLKTKDAHGLYEKFGFNIIEDPEAWMYRKTP
jgi:GNAT superfamily N-acetyltransferase